MISEDTVGMALNNDILDVTMIGIKRFDHETKVKARSER